MGDVFLPDNTYSLKMMFITPQGLYISEDHINNPAFSEDYMRFRLFTLERL
jgi:predicted DNA-binding transcriptional regulator YafY